MSFLLTQLQLLGHLQVQVVKTQWLLIVELHQFRNLYNAEVIDGYGFCCCDTSSNDYIFNCEEIAEYMDYHNCKPSCDTWLNASVSHCIEPNACSYSTKVRLNSASLYILNEKFIFVLSTCCSPDTVRITKSLRILFINRIFFC